MNQYSNNETTSQLKEENPLKLLLFEGFFGIINQTHTISFSISRREIFLHCDFRNNHKKIITYFVQSKNLGFLTNQFLNYEQTPM